MQKIYKAHQWFRALSKRYGEEKAAAILSHGETIYQDLLIISRTTTKKSYQKHNQILFSTLAMYRTLLENTSNPQTALSEIEFLFKDVYFRVQLYGIRLLNHLQNPFQLIRPVLKMMINYSDTENGQEIIRNDKNCFAVNVYQCTIFDTLKKHNSPELTPVFCASDDWLSAAMPKIQWQRTQTLGRGGEMCDFKWCNGLSSKDNMDRDKRY